MIRFIASDIDGTLLQNGETQISERFFREAARLASQGVILCAASGRQYKSLRNLFAPLADRMVFLCENGAVVFGPGEAPALISRTTIDRATSLALCHDILDIPGCELLMCGTNVSYLCPKTQDYEDHIRYFVGNNVTIVSSPEDVPEDFVKISAYYKDGAALIDPLLRPRWQDRFQVAIAGQPWLDFTVADKGTGINALLRHYGIDPSEAMAFGDNFNDAPMLDAVGVPYIMKGAAPALRERYPLQCERPEDILERL